jgi:SAM-dependent methyltransferase
MTSQQHKFSDIYTSFKHLYSDDNFRPIAFPDNSDKGFITVHLIERSISLFANRLLGRMLDVGCGQQPYRQYFNHVEYKLACDIDAKRGEIDFECQANQIPLKDCSLDSILCTEVLEHVPNPMSVWKEFYRLLRPGGQVLLTTPMYWPAHELPHDFFRYPEHGLKYLVAQSGFQLVAMVPRGGPWALWGQVTLHVMGHFFPYRWQVFLWNRIIIWIDRHCSGPRLTSGWTVLAQKPNDHTTI